MAFSLLAATVLYMAPEYFNTEVKADTPPTIGSLGAANSDLGYITELPDTVITDTEDDNYNPALVTKSTFDAYTLTLDKAIRFTELNTSDIEGIELLTNNQFVIDDDQNSLQQIKDYLAKDNTTSTKGFMTQLASMHDKLGPLVEKVEAFEIKSGQGPAYADAIEALKQQIHYIDAHMDFSADVPSILFEDVMYGEAEYNDSILTKASNLIIDGSSHAKPNAYPVPDLQWPEGGKPDHIQVTIKDNVTSTTFVDETAGETYSPTKPGGSTGWTTDLVAACDGGWPGGEILYKLTDTSTGKVNNFVLTIKYDPSQATKSISSRSTPPSPIGFDVITASNIPVPIYISEDGKDILTDKYWVTSEIYNNLKDALDDAVDALGNVYKDAAVDTGKLSDEFDLEVLLSSDFTGMVDANSDLFFTDETTCAKLPNEKKYSLANMPANNGTLKNHTSMTELAEASDNLATAYAAYISGAGLGTGEVIEKTNEAKLHSQIAKAFLGLNPANALPEIPAEGNIDISMNNVDASSVPIFNHFKAAGLSSTDFGAPENTMVGSVFIYTRPATQAEADDGNLPLVGSSNQDFATVVGDPVPSTKAEADGIGFYVKTATVTWLSALDPAKEGFADDSEFFIVPAIAADSYEVGNWIPGGAESALPETVGKFLDATQVTEQLKILEALLAEYDLYDGYDLAGNKLGGSQYTDELKAGAEVITPEEGYTATTKIGLVTEKLVKFYENIITITKEGEASKKEAALDTLKKYLLYVGYATMEPNSDPSGDSIFTVVDDKADVDNDNTNGYQTALDALHLNSKLAIGTDDPANSGNPIASETTNLTTTAFDPTTASDLDGITPRATDSYHNISNYYGVDATDSGHYWVTKQSHDALVTALKRAHNLVESGFITQTKADVDKNNTYIGTDNPGTDLESTDNKFYTSADIEAEILKVKTAIDTYDSIAQDSNKTDFQDDFINGTLAGTMTNINDIFELPTELGSSDLATYKVLYQTKLNILTNTVISDDGVFEITRDITRTAPAGYTFSPADVSLIQNKKLIDDGTITDYLLPADVKTAYTSIQPILDIYAVSGQFSDIHAAEILGADGTPDLDKTTALKAFMQGIIYDHYNYVEEESLEIETSGSSESESETGIFAVAEKALTDLETKKLSALPYKTPREALISTLGTIQESPTTDETGAALDPAPVPTTNSIRDLIRTDGNTAYIHDSLANQIVISEDEGYTYITYTPTVPADPSNNITAVPGKWSESKPIPTDQTDIQWTTKEALITYNNVLKVAEQALADSRPEAYLIDNNEDATDAVAGNLADDTKGPKMDPPDFNLTFAEATLNASVLEKIKSMMVLPDDPAEKLDYFNTQKDAVEKAKATFEATYKSVKDTSNAQIAYDAFVAEVGKAAFINKVATPGSEDPTTHDDLGYIVIQNTGGATITPGSGLMEEIFAFTNDDGKTKSYFPMDVYVVNDKYGIKNPITGLAYGYKTDANTVDDNAPTTFVPKDAANQLLDAIKIMDTFLAKDLSLHLKAFDSDAEYFKKELAKLQTAFDEFTPTAVKSGDYITAYETEFAKIVDSASEPTAPKSDFDTLKDETGADVTGAFTYNADLGTKKQVTDVLLATTIAQSEDGITHSVGDSKGDPIDDATVDYWITPSSFYKLKSAILKVQDIVTEAKKFSPTSIAGYATNENYFQEKYDLIGLEDIINEIFVTNYKPATTSEVADWILKAEILLYGDAHDADSNIGIGTQADAPGGDVPDMNISALTDGFDILTLAMMTAADTKKDGLDEADIEAINSISYISKDLADKLKYALSVVKGDDFEDEDVETLAKLVNEANNNKKVVSVLNNPKIDLYNTYTDAISKLTDENGYAILPSDNKGANVSRNKFWVTTASLNGLNTAISNSEKLLNTLETAKTAEISFKNQLINQKNLNARTVATFKPLPGTASQSSIDGLVAAKEKLLATINKAAALVGEKEYLADGSQNPNAIVLEEGQIVISTLFGTDVSGEDRDGNLIPDSGDRWTTTASHTALTRAILAAVNSYKAGGATLATIEKADEVLNLAIINLAKTSFYGTKETYIKVTALIQKYIDGVNKGVSNSVNRIPALSEVKVSTLSGTDVAITALWSTKVEKDKLTNAVKAAQTILNKYANVESPTVKLDLPKFIAELTKIEVAFENFYGQTIEGEDIAGIISKAQPGTDGLETLEIRDAIQNAVATMNGLTYLNGAALPKITYTLLDGTPNNAFGYDRYIQELGEWINKDDGKNGDGFSYTDILVSSKTRGMDVPVNFTWISSVAVNQYATAISVAQRTLDTFEATPEANQNQITLDNAVLALERATTTFENMIQPASSSLTGEKLTYDRNYKKLDAAIAEAYYSIEYSYAGENTEGTVLTPVKDTPLNINRIIKESLSGDGQDVSSSISYLPTNQFIAYKNAIINAVKARDMANANDKSLEIAFNNLEKTLRPIITRFVKDGQADARATKEGTLNGLIAEAEAYINGNSGAELKAAKLPIIASANGLDVPNDRYWTTPANLNNLINQLNLAKTNIRNLDTEIDPNTGLKGTGKTTLALLDRSITTLGNVIKLIEVNSGAPNLGKVQSTTDSGLAIAAKAELKRLMDIATAYSKYKTSIYEGTDLADGTLWITGLSLNDFSYEEDGNGQSVKPTTFMLQAVKNATTIYNKSPIAPANTPASVYELAAIDLQHCIDQFETVLNGTLTDLESGTSTSTLPTGETAEDVAYSGKGILTSINKAKADITAAVTQYNVIVRSTKPASSADEIAKVPDGQYYAESGDISTMTGAINKANTDLRSLQRTVGALKFFQDSLATLKTTYKLFTVGNPDATPNPIEPQRKLKGEHATPSDAVSLALTALEDLFSEENGPENVIVPLKDSTNSMDPTSAGDYLKSFIEKVINNENVIVTLDSPTIGTAPRPGTATSPEGTPGAGTVKITLSDKNNNTNSQEIAIAHFSVAAVPYKWSDVTKSDVLSSVALINAAKDKLSIDGGILDAKIDDTLTTDDLVKQANGQKAAAQIKKEIEKLIANDSITVTIVAGDSTITDALTEGKNLNHASGIAAAGAAYTKVQINDTAKDPGEDGTFTFNVVLGINYTDISAHDIMLMNDPIEEKVDVTEITLDGDGGAENLDRYTVILNGEIEIKVTPGAYKESSASDATAVMTAIKAFNTNYALGGTFTIKNTLDKPGHTEELVKAQLSEQIRALLVKPTKEAPNGNDPSIDYKAFQGVTFEIETVTTGTTFPSDTGAGTYCFKINFIKGNEKGSPTGTDWTHDATGINIPQNPKNPVNELKKAIENLPEYINDNPIATSPENVYFNLTTDNASNKSEADEAMLAFLKTASATYYADIEITLTSEYKAPILSTATKFGTDGFYKFIATLKKGERELKTFSIYMPIIALPYKESQKMQAMNDMLLSLGVDVNDLADFEESPDYDNANPSDIEDLDFIIIDDQEFTEEFLAEDEVLEYEYLDDMHFDDNLEFDNDFESELEEVEDFFDEEQLEYQENYEEELLEEFVKKQSKSYRLISSIINLFKRS